MKKGLVLFFISIILILSLGVISAGWFSDFFGKITGKATSGTCNVNENYCDSTYPQQAIYTAAEAANACEQDSACYFDDQGLKCIPVEWAYYGPGGTYGQGNYVSSGNNYCSTFTTQGTCPSSACIWAETAIPSETKGEITYFTTDKNSYIVGETATFTMGVKNTGTTKWESAGPAPPITVYKQSQDFNDLGYPASTNIGKTRVGIDVNSEEKYRWRWSTTYLNPGEGAIIDGKVKWETAGKYTLCAGVVLEWIKWMDKDKFCKIITVSPASVSECEEGHICLGSDNPNITVTFGNINYEVELFSATISSAIIRVKTYNIYPFIRDTKEVNKGEIKEINGLNVYLKSVDVDANKISAVLKLSPATSTPPPTTECIDGDGGINESVQGYTAGFQIGRKDIISKNDYCILSSKNLIEFFCEEPNLIYNYKHINNVTIECPSNCYNGACINSSFDVSVDKTEGFAPLAINYIITKDYENNSCVSSSGYFLYVGSCNDSKTYYYPGNYTLELGVFGDRNLFRLFNITVFSPDFSIENFRPLLTEPNTQTKIYFEDIYGEDISKPAKIRLVMSKISGEAGIEAYEENYILCNNPIHDNSKKRFICVIEFNYNFPEEGEYKFLIQNLDENDKEIGTLNNEKTLFVFDYSKPIENHQFPIGLWTYAGEDYRTLNLNQFSAIKELGIDTIIDSNYNDPLFNYGKRLLLEAQKNGIRVMLADTGLKDFKNAESYTAYLSLVSANLNKDFKSLYRFYLKHEPEYFNQIDDIGKSVNILNSRDEILGTTTLYQDLRLIEYYYKNVNSQEVIVDHYPLDSNTPIEGQGLQEKFDELTITLNELNTLSKLYNKPFWFMVQAHQWGNKEFYTRNPTPKEIRAMTNLAIAYGAKGIFYYYYWSDSSNQIRGLVNENFQPNEKYYEVQKINQNLNKIKDTLINLDNVGTCNTESIGNRLEN